jgi:hypothetical protein
MSQPTPPHLDYRAQVENFMTAMGQGRVRPLFDAMAADVTWRWMGVKQWSRAIEGKQSVVDTLFGGNSGSSDSPMASSAKSASTWIRSSSRRPSVLTRTLEMDDAPTVLGLRVYAAASTDRRRRVPWRTRRDVQGPARMSFGTASSSFDA